MTTPNDREPLEPEIGHMLGLGQQPQEHHRWMNPPVHYMNAPYPSAPHRPRPSVVPYAPAAPAAPAPPRWRQLAQRVLEIVRQIGGY